MEWIKHWYVTGTSGKRWKVSQNTDGGFGCECPAWRFQKGARRNSKECQHILQIRLKEGIPQPGTPAVKSSSTSKKFEIDQPIRALSFED